MAGNVPDEARQFARHRRHDLRRMLAGSGQTTELRQPGIILAGVGGLGDRGREMPPALEDLVTVLHLTRGQGADCGRSGLGERSAESGLLKSTPFQKIADRP